MDEDLTTCDSQFGNSSGRIETWLFSLTLTLSRWGEILDFTARDDMSFR